VFVGDRFNNGEEYTTNFRKIYNESADMIFVSVWDLLVTTSTKASGW